MIPGSLALLLLLLLLLLVLLQVWEFPRIFNKDYRRHIRKFQFLGMYGLPPVGTQLQQQRQGPSSSSSSSNELPDSLQWLMMSVQ